MALVSHWKLDESAANTTVSDTNATDAATTNGSNTSAIAVGTGNGPGGSAADAGFTFGADADCIINIDSQSAAGLGNACTVALAFKVTDETTTDSQVLFETGGSTSGMGMFIAGGNLYFTRTYSSTPINASVTCPSDGNWHHATGYYNTTGTKIGIILDGGTASDEVTNAGLSATTTGGNAGGIGLHNGSCTAPVNNPIRIDGSIAWVKVWDSDESANAASEASEVGIGSVLEPPTYTSGASLGSNGAYNVGTWDSHGNGTITYIVSAVNAAGDVLESNTTATGTLDLSGNAGNTCYLLVRASNDDGYGDGDYATRTSGFGSADDGYYEVASVVAAGGVPDYTITQSAAAAVEVSGLTGSLVVARSVTQSAPAAIEVAGLSGSLEVSRSLNQSSPSAVEVAGLAGSLSVSRQITQSAPAAVEVSGLEGTLTYSGEGGPTYTLTQTAPAAVEVAGLSGSLAVSRQIIQSAPASVEVEGQDGALTLAYRLNQSATADVEVSGLAGSLLVARQIVQSAAAGVAVQGRTGTLTYSEEVDTPTTVTGNYAAVAAPQNAGAVAAPQNYQAVAAPQNYAAARVSN